MTQNLEVTMSKLYTEEQVRDMLNINVEFDHYTPNIDSILSDYTPIQLPTDEKIEKVAEKKLSVNFLSFIEGAKWMRDKIKGGADE